eukprot:Sspe_Gene.107691::Locus_86038_Transcript_1_1_Confidence_1.000_Length_2332::g.107691::m.107691
MACYIEAAAACDLTVVRASPVNVNVNSIHEQESIRRYHRSKALKPVAECTPTLPSLPSVSRTASPVLHSVQHPPADLYLSLLEEVAQCCDAMDALPVSLRERIEVAIKSKDYEMEKFVTQSNFSGKAKKTGSIVSFKHTWDDDEPSPSTAFASKRTTLQVTPPHLPLEPVIVHSPASPNSCKSSPQGTSLVPSPVRRKSDKQIVRCGQRRFTVTAVQKMEDGKKVSPWRIMQNRLAEIKLQTILQSVTSEKGARAMKVVLTGGPCAGKSTGMAMLRQELEKRGVLVFCVPEAATILIEGGGNACFKDADDEKIFSFQLALLESQMALEDAFSALAKAVSQGRKSVLLCDRGSMDGRAFCSEEIWDRILQEGEWTTAELRDGRYDVVVHLVTAADGAETYYGTENNTARTESPEEARLQDQKLQKMWLGHPKLRIIDNSTGFAEKMSRCLGVILEFLGFQDRPGVQKRFELSTPPPDDLPVHTAVSQVRIHELRGSKPDNIMRIIERRDGAAYVYTYHNTRRKHGQTYRVESPLTKAAYLSMMNQVDPRVPCVQKTIRSFVYQHQYFELATYTEPKSKVGCTSLHVQTQMGDDGKEVPVVFPDFLVHCGLHDVTNLPDTTQTSPSLACLVGELMKMKKTSK